MYKRLYKLDIIDYANPLEKIELLKLQERGLTYLTTEQIAILRKAVQQSQDWQRLLAIVDLCLATGARWSEAEKITKAQIAPDRVTYVLTKSKKARTVQIDARLSSRLRSLLPLAPCGNRFDAFSRAVARSGIELPKGQLTHVLRHSFASHYIMNGGNIIALQKILGQSSINITMRYAHLADDFTSEAVQLNSLGQSLDGENK